MFNINKGILLISEPSLDDVTFFKSIILITHHSDNESIGLILNQSTKINLNDIVKDIPSSNFPIYIGGPVEKNTIQFIHTLGRKIPNSREISEDLYWGGDFNKIIDLISKGKILKHQIRFFAGYSGWGEGQLKKEIIEDSWIMHKPSTKICMQYSDGQLWSKLIRTKKEKYAIWTNMPKDPSLN